MRIPLNSFMVSMLFYLGAMQWIVVKIGFLLQASLDFLLPSSPFQINFTLQITVGTTACESLNTAANIFLGQSEAPLLIKPFLKVCIEKRNKSAQPPPNETLAPSGHDQV